MPLETRAVDLAEIVRLTATVSTPATVTVCAYLGVRAMIQLVAVFGPKEEWAQRAIEVLKVLRRDRSSK
jgi:hypothetical protein